MKTLTVELKVPIHCEQVVGVPALTFGKWFPLGQTHGIPIKQSGIEMLLWFDLASTATLIREEEISKHVNIPVRHVRVNATISGVSEETAGYMQTKDFSRQPNASEAKKQGEYDEIAASLLRLTIESVNRLIAYARAIKGQYWLLDWEPNLSLSQAYQQFEAIGKIDNGRSFRFLPNTSVRLTIIVPSDDRYITEHDWLEVTRFVQGDQRIPFVLDLLARAERLAANGHSRTALTEAVTALEIALSTFGDSKDANGKLAGAFGGRVGVAKLSNQIKALGLRGTIRFLLPLILKEEILPNEIVVDCQEAIDERNNVVHNGQRDVTDVKKYVKSIKQCCEILRSYELV